MANKNSPELEQASRDVVIAALRWVTKPMLVNLCREAGLKTRGTKDELSNRIWKHFDSCQSKVMVNHEGGGVIVTVKAWKRGG